MEEQEKKEAMDLALECRMRLRGLFRAAAMELGRLDEALTKLGLQPPPKALLDVGLLEQAGVTLGTAGCVDCEAVAETRPETEEPSDLAAKINSDSPPTHSVNVEPEGWQHIEVQRQLGDIRVHIDLLGTTSVNGTDYHVVPLEPYLVEVDADCPVADKFISLSRTGELSGPGDPAAIYYIVGTGTIWRWRKEDGLFYPIRVLTNQEIEWRKNQLVPLGNSLTSAAIPKLEAPVLAEEEPETATTRSPREKVFDCLLESYFHESVIKNGIGSLRVSTENGLRQYTENIAQAPAEALRTWPTGFYRAADSSRQLLIRLTDAILVVDGLYDPSRRVIYGCLFTSSTVELMPLSAMTENESMIFIGKLEETMKQQYL